MYVRVCPSKTRCGMDKTDRKPWLRIRLRMILLVVAFLALVVAVVVQQMQIERMRRAMNVIAKQRVQEQNVLTTIVRELRGKLERQR